VLAQLLVVLPQPLILAVRSPPPLEKRGDRALQFFDESIGLEDHEQQPLSTLANVPEVATFVQASFHCRPIESPTKRRHFGYETVLPEVDDAATECSYYGRRSVVHIQFRKEIL